MKSCFIWPNSEFPKTFKSASPRRVENRLGSMWPGAHPVLVSSGRVGIALALQLKNVGRGTEVGLGPYASYCAVDAVSRVATPLCGAGAEQAECRVLYHQYGFVQEGEGSALWIEDAVDTLCVPGDGLFPAGGDIEIWSLPKIIGSASGGVVWCRNAGDADRLRGLRDASEVDPFPHWFLRMLGKRWLRFHYYWEGRETLAGRLPSVALGEIIERLDGWKEIVRDRLEKLELVQSLLPDGLCVSSNRLPCVVPVLDVDEQTANTLGAMGFSSGHRHMEMIRPDQSREVVKMFPLPIHQDVPLEKLTKARDLILKAGN